MNFGFIQIHPLIIICIVILGILWIWNLISFILKIPELKKIRTFYNKSLCIQDSRLSSMDWKDILNDKLEYDQLNKFLMQKNNFMIELFKEENWDQLGIHRKFVSKLFNWILFSSLDILFDNPKKYEPILEKIEKMKKYYLYIGISIILLSPFIIVFLIMYYFFKYTIEFKNSPASAGIRDWNIFARWKLRNMNELPHDFEKRLIKLNKPMYEFLDTNHISIISIIAKFITFVTGSFLAVLTVLTIYDDHILVVTIDNGGRSVLWYMGFFSIILSLSTSFIPNYNRDYDSNKFFEKIVEHTNYTPSGDMDENVSEYNSLFSYKLTQLFYEIISILAMPYLLYMILQNCDIMVHLFFDTMEYEEESDGYYLKIQDKLSESNVSIKSNSSHGSNNSDISGLNRSSHNIVEIESPHKERKETIPISIPDQSFIFENHKTNTFNYGDLFNSLLDDNVNDVDVNNGVNNTLDYNQIR